jgi:hypothetical protein
MHMHSWAVESEEILSSMVCSLSYGPGQYNHDQLGGRFSVQLLYSYSVVSSQRPIANA